MFMSASKSPQSNAASEQANLFEGNGESKISTWECNRLWRFPAAIWYIFKYIVLVFSCNAGADTISFCSTARLCRSEQQRWDVWERQKFEKAPVNQTTGYEAQSLLLQCWERLLSLASLDETASVSAEIIHKVMPRVSGEFLGCKLCNARFYTWDVIVYDVSHTAVPG